MSDEPLPNSEIILYQTEDGRTRIQCRFENETIWLTQKRMAELFQKDVRTINEHIQNVFEEGELSPDSVIRKFRITAADGKTYDTQRDWITKLDEFLKISGRKLLDHAGKISAESAKMKAELEYARYRKLLDAQPQRIDAEFEKAAKELKKLPRPKKPKPPKQ